MKTIVYSILILLWTYGSIPIFSYEAQTLKIYPQISKLSEDEKRFLVDGPIYIMLKAAQSGIPAGSTVAFLNHAEKATAAYNRYKMGFHLPARTIESIEPGQMLTEEILNRSDYVLILDRDQNQRETLEKLNQNPRLQKVFEHELKEQKIYQAIYQVRKTE